MMLGLLAEAESRPAGGETGSVRSTPHAVMVNKIITKTGSKGCKEPLVTVVAPACTVSIINSAAACVHPDLRLDFLENLDSDFQLIVIQATVDDEQQALSTGLAHPCLERRTMFVGDLLSDDIGLNRPC